MKNKSIARLSLRKLLLSALVAAPLATLPAPLWALPTSASNLAAQVASTSAGVTVNWVSATQVDVNATQNTSVVRWNDFGAAGMTIVSGDVVNFNQPSNTSALLNQVGGTNPTTIDGRLNSNGILYVMNQNGITVTTNGVINAAGVGLTTAPESDLSFLSSGALTYPATTTSGDIAVQGAASITAASGSGNVWIVGNDIALAGTIAGGNVVVRSQNNGNIALGSGAVLTVGASATPVANLSVTATGTGGITVAQNANVIVNGPSVSLTTGNVAIGQGSGYLQIGAGGSASSTLTTNSGTATTTISNVRANGSANTVTVNMTGSDLAVASGSGGSNLAVGATASGYLNVTALNGNVTLNTSTVAGNLGVGSARGILSGGNVTVTGTANLVAAPGANLAFTGKAASLSVSGEGGAALGNVVLTGTDALALGTISATNLTVTAAKDLTQTGTQTATGTTSLTATGNVTLSQAITSPTLTVTAGNNITQNDGVVLTVTGNATFNAQGGNLTLDALTGATNVTGTAAKLVTLSDAIGASGSASFTAGTDLAVNGTINSATVNLTGANITDTAVITSSGTTTVTGSNSVVLDQSHALTNLVVKGTAGNVTVNDAGGVTLANGTNTSGNLTITSTGAVALGAAAADTISVGKKLTLTAVGVTDEADNISVTEDLAITSTGAVVLNGSTQAVTTGIKSSYGTVHVSAAGQAVTVYEGADLKIGNVTATSLRAYSTSGISNNGGIIVTDLVVGAGTATAPGDIVLTSSTNAISGTISILTDLELLNPASNVKGDYLVRDFSLTNSGAGVFSVGPNVYGAGLTGSITLAAVGTANLNVGQLLTTGPVTLSSVSGYIDADHVGNTFTTVTVNSESTSATASSVSSSKDLTVNATIGGNATGNFGFGTTGNLTIGQFRSLGTGETSFTATGNVMDSTAGLFIYGTTKATGKNISLTSGGNFGQVWLTTTGNGNATIVESGTLNLKSVNTGTGFFAATSQTGSIIEAGATGSITAGTVTLQANNGAITLDGTTNAIGNIAMTAKDSSLLKNTVATVLGATNVTVGNLTVNQANDTKISQLSGSAINVNGTATFTTTNAGTITLANSGNQFGALTLTTGSGNIAVTESGTLNLKSVSTSGNLTAASETADIIDSGTLTVNGTATFLAPAGSVTLDEAGSNFGMVVFGNATKAVAGNVAVTDAAGLVIGSANIGGTFAATAKTGNIGQVDAIKVFGDVTLLTDTATATRIELNHASNEFGGVQFKVGSGGALLREATTFALNPGSSSASGSPVTIRTGGNFVTAAGGGSTFNGDLTIDAVGTIIPSAGAFLVTGTFTVISNDIVNLSALSKSANLNAKDPVHTAVPADKYTAPSP